MENKFINFAQPLITDDEIKEVVDTLKSGWITTGPKVKEFENRICVYTGAKYAVATFSGTSALFLSLKASGIKEDDEVIVPTFTFASTAHVVVHCGAMPVFVDSDPKTFQIDTTKIEERITAKTKAIIPVHYGGNLVEMEDIFMLARKYNLKVIEDAAHAIGSEYQGRKIGSLDSNATCFSFYATKNLATGEGGMVVTGDKELADMVRKMTMYGISDSREIWNSRYTKKGHWFYDIEVIGYKANMTDLNAALGLHQLARLGTFNATRQKYAAIYKENLKDAGCDFMRVLSNNKCCWHLFPLLLAEHIDRDEFIIQLKECGIGASVLFRPLHLHTAYKNLFSAEHGDFPISESIYNRLINLPLSPSIKENDILYVCKTIKTLIGEFIKN
jgi:dTDP-4-amino-4,6-dideoxygalactose transaminase